MDPFETTWGERTTVEAILRIQAEPGSKRFQGVSLEREGQPPLLIDYRAKPKWRAFEDRRVRATGRPYTPGPATQHIMADHFSVETIVALDPMTLVGMFTSQPMGPPGSKLADSIGRYLVLDDGARWRLMTADDTWVGRRVEVVGRPTAYGDSYVAQTGERLLEVDAVRER